MAKTLHCDGVNTDLIVEQAVLEGQDIKTVLEAELAPHLYTSGAGSITEAGELLIIIAELIDKTVSASQQSG